MKFRRATIDDIEVMSDIRISVVENALSDPTLITRKMYEDYLGKLGRGWVCELDNHIVGFSYAEKKNHSIWALFVKPEFEGVGAGKGLIRLATQWLFEIGAEKISLDTEADTRADNFYKIQGWVRGDMKNEYEVTYSLMRSNMPNKPFKQDK
jgi:GNAT superfamily N-acetyltransferase